MKVLFDSQIFGMQDYGGISRYFVQILKRFNKKEVLPIVSLIVSHNDYIKDLGIGYYDNLLSKSGYRNYVYTLINAFLDIPKILFSKYDIFHPTYYETHSLPFVGKKPLVLTVYDMVHELYINEYPDLKQRVADNKKKLIDKATHIISISENTKKDIVNIYKVDPSKVSVVYLANSLDAWDGVIRLRLPKKYIIYNGHRWIYKNFDNFVKAVAKLLIETDTYLVCAGGNEFTHSEMEMFKKLKISDRVMYQKISGVDHDRHMSECYSRALAFVYPSKYEGFGIPILEAFANSCPVVVSNSSCFPEIAKDAAVYFDINNHIDIEKKLKSVIKNKVLRQELVKKGKIRLNYFSWEKAAKQTTSIYKMIISQK